MQQRVITFIGATSKFGATGNRDEKVCQALGKLLASDTTQCYIINTGGVGGFPAYVSQAFAQECKALNQSLYIPNTAPQQHRIRHYVPYGSKSITKDLEGDTFECAKDMKERRKVLVSMKCDAVIAISGGPGTADEINLALKHGQKLVSFVGSGGAAAGKIGDDNNIIPAIPKESLANPIVCSEDPKVDPVAIAKELYNLIQAQFTKQ